MAGNESTNGAIPALAPNRVAEWVLLLAQLPGQSPKPSGVLLLDAASDELHVALLDSVSADADVSEVWDCLGQDLRQRTSEVGGARLLASLEADLSLFLQLGGPRQRIATAHPKQTLQVLFETHVLNASALSQSGNGD